MKDESDGGRLPAARAGLLDSATVLDELGSTRRGLSSDDATLRLATFGHNAIRSHGASAATLLIRQFESPLLLLLLVTAAVSFAVGEHSSAVIIAVILTLSIGLGFRNEYAAAVAAAALHSQLRHTATVRRDGRWQSIDVTDLVPGDIVKLELGSVVPADIRLLDVRGLECDESVLTGESLPVEKSADPGPRAHAATPRSCAMMGTVVRSGAADGVVIATAGNAQFGRIALELGRHQPDTEFQLGLARFSAFLAKIALVLSAAIIVINVVLRRPLIDAVLFSLAIAVGITPQLLPAVVTTCLATGSQRLARLKILVKRLVVIEDLGDITVLITDKTGTLTEGRITFEQAVDETGQLSSEVHALGLVCNTATVEDGVAVAGNDLDIATWAAGDTSQIAGYTRVATLPFDHERRMTSVVVDAPAGSRLLISKGAPEDVLARCTESSTHARDFVNASFESGRRTVAVAVRSADGMTAVTAADEHDLTLAGFIVFLDPPKASASASIARLARLGVAVKIATGDNATVAQRVCRDLGMDAADTLSGEDVDALNDEELTRKLATTTIIARISPEQKARIVRVQRQATGGVAFLGDGVNDALALHDADVGISVDGGTDVAKDAADVILLEKDLGVLADGVAEGRRTFANTIKYVLMGTSSNFGNMFSAAAASIVLPFLPMLPYQILLNNLLYDASQLTIPTDSVDPEMVASPAHWDIGFVRRFMLWFGPISSAFDFLTFGLMLVVFRADEALFQAGWFVESLATQTLIIFAIRTRRTPFFRSRPSRPVLIAAITVVLIGAALPESPLRNALGFATPPLAFFAVLAGMVAAYIAVVDLAKYRFFRGVSQRAPRRPRTAAHRTHRRAARWSRAVPMRVSRPRQRAHRTGN